MNRTDAFKDGKPRLLGAGRRPIGAAGTLPIGEVRGEVRCDPSPGLSSVTLPPVVASRNGEHVPSIQAEGEHALSTTEPPHSLVDWDHLVCMMCEQEHRRDGDERTVIMKWLVICESCIALLVEMLGGAPLNALLDPNLILGHAEATEDS